MAIEVGDQVKLTQNICDVPAGTVGVAEKMVDGGYYWVVSQEDQCSIWAHFNELEKIGEQSATEEEWAPPSEEELRRRKHEALAKMLGFS